MYEAYWQLDAKPFENVLSADYYYPGETHQGALLKLRYAIENHREAAVLAGGSGLGKTLLLHQLRGHLPENVSPVVHVVFPQMPPAELLAYVAVELGAADASSDGSVDRSIRRIQTFLSENARLGRHAVLAIDEAHLLEETENLETVRLLLNFQHDGGPPWTVLLIGHTRILPSLDRMPGLEERLGAKCLLRPLSLEETISYVNHRLTAAGAARTIFETESFSALFHLSGGSPRRINRLCDLALLIGYAEERSTITSDQLESVSQELVAVSPE